MKEGKWMRTAAILFSISGILFIIEGIVGIVGGDIGAFLPVGIALILVWFFGSVVESSKIMN